MPRTPEQIRSNCNKCKGNTNQTVVAEHRRARENKEEGIWDETRWQVVKCDGCDTISQRTVVIFSDDYDEDTYCYIPTITCFPPPEKDTLPAKPLLNVPRTIRQVYAEVIDTFNRGSLLLCAGGLRAIVEGICHAENIQDGPVEVKKKDGTTKIERRTDLRAKIEGMAEKGLVTKIQCELLHEHRFLGNEALHELDTPNRDEIKLAIEILEHTLEHFYEIRLKAAALRTLKGKRRGRP